MASLASSDDTETSKLISYQYMLKHDTGTEKGLVL